MAEYISKDKLKRKKVYHFQTKGGAFPKSEPFVKLDDISNIPVADVVEREKINAALDEARRIRITVLGNNGRYESDEVLSLVEDLIGLFEEL